MQIDPNEKARQDLAAEKKAAGIPDKKSSKKSEDEEEVDMGDLDDDTIVEEEEEHADEETETEDSEEEDEESDESDDDEPDDKKKIPKKFLDKEKKKRLKLKEERDTLRQQLKEALDEKQKIMAKLPDDLDDKISDLAKEIGVEDPENLKKMIKFVKEIGGKDIADIREQLAILMKGNHQETQSVQFSREWDSFKPILEKEFPAASKEEIEKAQKLMDKLSHTDGIGGRKFKADDGNEQLDPYPLDYILFKNRDKFEEVMTAKRKKGLESGRSQGITRQSDAPKKLPKNASAAQIRQREKELMSLEDGGDGLRTPENREI